MAYCILFHVRRLALLQFRATLGAATVQGILNRHVPKESHSYATYKGIPKAKRVARLTAISLVYSLESSSVQFQAR